MGQEYSKDIYREYSNVIESSGIEIPADLEALYKKYIKEKMSGMPYLDPSVVRMYTLVFFLKYVKQIQGTVKFKNVYSKLDMQKKLITRAMESVNIDFGLVSNNPIFIEDWSSLYSINKKCGASLIKPKTEQIQ